MNPQINLGTRGKLNLKYVVISNFLRDKETTGNRLSRRFLMEYLENSLSTFGREERNNEEIRHHFMFVIIFCSCHPGFKTIPASFLILSQL
jgi:hypothetical protein